MKTIFLTVILFTSCSSNQNLYDRLQSKETLYLVDTCASFEPGVYFSLKWVLGSKPGDKMIDGEWIITYYIAYDEKGLSIEEYDNYESKVSITTQQLKSLAKKIEVSNKKKVEDFENLDLSLKEMELFKPNKKEDSDLNTPSSGLEGVPWALSVQFGGIKL